MGVDGVEVHRELDEACVIVNCKDWIKIEGKTSVKFLKTAQLERITLQEKFRVKSLAPTKQQCSKTTHAR